MAYPTSLDSFTANVDNVDVIYAAEVNDVLMVALDMDNGKVWMGKNGTWFNSGDPAAGTNAAFTGLSGTLYAGLTLTNTNVTVGVANFGATTMGYTAPSGFRQGLYSGTADTKGNLLLRGVGR